MYNNREYYEFENNSDKSNNINENYSHTRSELYKLSTSNPKSDKNDSIEQYTSMDFSNSTRDNDKTESIEHWESQKQKNQKEALRLAKAAISGKKASMSQDSIEHWKTMREKQKDKDERLGKKASMSQDSIDENFRESHHNSHRCHRNMYRKYKTSCMCATIIKLIMFVFMIWLICKLMNYSWAEKINHSDFIRFV